MSSQPLLLLIGILSLGIGGIIFAAIAWARTNALSLPLPVLLPAVNVLLPVLTAIVWPVSQRLVNRVRKNALRSALPYLARASTFAPFVLLILSLVYAMPSDMQACATDQHWLRMFENKNGRGIRNIQTALQCCGLNSMHDRAWPFPSRNVDARACERTQGYTVACGGMWRQEEAIAAILTGIASFLNWLMMVLTVVNFPQAEGHVHLPAWHTRPRPMIADVSEGEEQNTVPPTDRISEEERRGWGSESGRDI